MAPPETFVRCYGLCHGADVVVVVRCADAATAAGGRAFVDKFFSPNHWLGKPERQTPGRISVLPERRCLFSSYFIQSQPKRKMRSSHCSQLGSFSHHFSVVDWVSFGIVRVSA